ncbi:MAG: N-acetylmuramoyl-L-alanine amidase [Vicinamibacterales bacterium]
MLRLARTVAFVLLAAATAVPVAWTQQTPPALTILSREGRRAVPLTVINNQDYVLVDDLAGPFGTSAREAAGGLTIAANGRTIIVTADQSVVSAAGRLVSLPVPALRRDGRWYVPSDFISRALAPVLDRRLDLRRASRLVVADDLRVPRVVARVESGATTTVTLEVTPAAASRVSAEAGRLIVQFEADALDLTVPPLPPTQGFLTAVGPGTAPNTVALATGPRYGAYRSSSSQPDAGSARLVIELMPSTSDLAAAVPPPAPAPALSPAPDLRPSIMTPATGLRTVVIDPGHGGDEDGAHGPRGTLEKDITLAVSRRLRTLIESRMGLRVFLTREDDRTVSHDDRSAIANNQRADVFLSIHANAAGRAQVSGAEVYYLSIDRADEEARRRAADQAIALPSLGGGTRTIDLILWETAQARYLEQSSSLAGLIEQALRERVEMSPRAVQQAPFRVLVGANMPAALVEIGYLSNPAQEQQLGTAEYQTRVAEALFDALVRFRGVLERMAP